MSALRAEYFHSGEALPHILSEAKNKPRQPNFIQVELSAIINFENMILPSLQKEELTDSDIDLLIELVNTHYALLPSDYSETNFKRLCEIAMEEVTRLLAPELAHAMNIPQIKESNTLKRLKVTSPSGRVYRNPGCYNTLSRKIYVSYYHEVDAAAHEQAHRLGLKDEDDTETAALLALIGSGDVRIRYIGLKHALLRLSSLFRIPDDELARRGLNKSVIAEENKYRQLYQDEPQLSRIDSFFYSQEITKEREEEILDSYFDSPLSYMLPWLKNRYEEHGPCVHRALGMYV